MEKIRPEKIRINKYIASTGLTSRRGADELIQEGKVKVNGKIVKEPGMLITEKDIVFVDDKKIEVKGKKYYIFNKPPGYITAKSDPQGRKTIYDILPDFLKNLNSVGRLDKDSSGLLILTNDGEILQKLTHPSVKVAKIYKVTIEGKLTREELIKLENGIEIEEGKIAYAEVVVLEYIKGVSTLQATLYQGYNRQIRRMMEILGHPVKTLKRLAHASVNISGMERGQYRQLRPKEVSNLKDYLRKRENNPQA